MAKRIALTEGAVAALAQRVHNVAQELDKLPVPGPGAAGAGVEEMVFALFALSAAIGDEFRVRGDECRRLVSELSEVDRQFGAADEALANQLAR